MLTPSFHISQDEEHLIITLRTPYTQLKDIEISALGSDFLFYSSPYFLRLKFPCEVVDDDEPPARFNRERGEFEVRLRKLNVGQHFPDLDLLGTLLAPKKQPNNIKPSIEVLDENIDEADAEDEDWDEWLIDQELPPEEPTVLPSAPKYGFGNLTHGVFNKIKSEFNEIIDLPDPDNTPAHQRDALRTAAEDEKFDSSHYLADLMELDVVKPYLLYTPQWYSDSATSAKLTAVERDYLKNLGNKEFLLSKEDKNAAWLSLVDIVFAYAYNHRTTLGENTVESAWTINKLSATLSWFTCYKNSQSVILSCFRRLLTYSLYRNWELAELVWQDTLVIFKLGRRQVLKCLLEVHSLFTHSEPRYLLNQLYITDYCIWLQRVSEKKLAKFTGCLEEVTISRGDVGFDLEELEYAARLAQEEEKLLEERFARMKLQEAEKRPSSGSSYESDSSYTSGTESDSSPLDSDDDSFVVDS